MSTLTANTLLPGKTAELVASGAIAAGKPVILNSTGTTSQVSETVYAEDIPGGDEQNIDANIIYGHEIAIDPRNGNILAAFRGHQSVSGPLVNYGYVSYGVVDGEDITWGTPTAFNSQTMHTNPIDVRFDPNNTAYFVVAFSDTYSTYARKASCMLGTVTTGGVFGSFGSKTNFQSVSDSSGTVAHNQIGFDPNTANQFAFCSAYGGSNICGIWICTYNNSSMVITKSSSNNVVANQNTGHSGVVWNPHVANEIICHYQYSSSPYYGRLRRGTVSGSSGSQTVSYGTEIVLTSTNTDWLDFTFDPNTAGSFVAAWMNSNVGPDAESKAGTLSGDTWTLGSIVKPPDPGSAGTIEVEFDPNQAGKLLFLYRSSVNSYKPRIATGTVSGTTVDWSDDATVITSEPTENAQGGGTRLAFFPDSKGKFVVTYLTTGSATNPNDICAKIGQTAASITNLTAANFLGIADEAIANTATGSISIKGGLATEGLSSLTSGSDYYAQADATINTTSTSPAIKIGKALSATALNLEYRS